MKIVQSSIGHIQTSARPIPPALSTYSSLTDLDDIHLHDQVRTPSGATSAPNSPSPLQKLAHAYISLHDSSNGNPSVSFKLSNVLLIPNFYLYPRLHQLPTKKQTNNPSDKADDKNSSIFSDFSLLPLF